MFSNWQYRILALILAFFCWYLVAGREKVDTWVEVPVELAKAPEHMVIREGLQAKIEVRIRGPKPLVRALEPKNLAYSLDLSGLVPGKNVVPFDPDRVPVPGALKVVEFNPPRMTLEVDRLIRKRVKVEPRWAGEIDKDYHLVNATARPPEVDLMGPEAVVGGLESVATVELAVASAKPSHISLDAGFELPPEVVAAPGEVRVDLYFGEKTVDAWVKAPVRIAPGGPDLSRVSPSTIKLKVSVSVSLKRDENFGNKFEVYVDVPPNLPAGRHELDFKVRLPPGCRLLQAVPEKIVADVKR